MGYAGEMGMTPQQVLRSSAYSLPFSIIYLLLAKALKSGRFKLLSILELTSLGRLEPRHIIILVLPPAQWGGLHPPLNCQRPPQLLLWDPPTRHMLSFSGPHWTWFVCPHWDRKFARWAGSHFQHSPTGVVSRIIQVFPHCSVLCLHQGVFNRLWGPGRELVGWGVCLREAAAHQRGWAEPRRQHLGGRSGGGGAIISLHEDMGGLCWHSITAFFYLTYYQ